MRAVACVYLLAGLKPAALERDACEVRAIDCLAPPAVAVLIKQTGRVRDDLQLRLVQGFLSVDLGIDLLHLCKFIFVELGLTVVVFVFIFV